MDMKQNGGQVIQQPTANNYIIYPVKQMPEVNFVYNANNNFKKR